MTADYFTATEAQAAELEHAAVAAAGPAPIHGGDELAWANPDQFTAAELHAAHANRR